MASEGFAVGYNVKQANVLMGNIKKTYEDLKLYINDGWEEVLNSLHKNWVGEDEQSFEVNLANRICTLYDNAYALAQGSLDTIEGLVNSWYQFQKTNTLDGSESAGNKGSWFFGIGGNSLGLDKPNISKSSGDIVKPKLEQLTAETDRGLAASNSASLIQQTVTTFVNNIKKKTADLFESIEANKAFFGEQVSSIKSYIEKTGEAIGEVTVALKDLYTALETLANSSYTKASTDVADQFVKASGSVDQSLNDLGNTRWNA